MLDASFALAPFRLSGQGRAAFASACVGVLAAVACGYGGAPQIWLAASLVLIAASAWFLDSDTNIWLYLVTLGLQVPQDFLAFRVGISDLFLLPLLARTGWALLRERRWVRSAFDAPFLLLGLAFLVANIVGYHAGGGRLTFWGWFNKDLGIVFLVAGFLAMARQLATPERMRSAIAVFVVGVSITNVAALFFGILSLTVHPNTILLVGSNRLNGWMQNPSANGSLLLVALCLELPRLAGLRAGAGWTIARWINYGLLLTGIGLTLSRSVWLSTAVAGGVLLLLGLSRRWKGFGFTKLQLAAALVTAILPAGIIGWIAVVQWQSVQHISQDQHADRAEQLRRQLVDTCVTKWDPELCHAIPPAQIAAARDARLRGDGGTSSRGPAASPGAATDDTDPPPAPAPAINPDGAMMNARGLDDRAAILRIATRMYLETPESKALGIGLGRFYARSAADFGVPIIIHNSPVWFLVELGPLGFLAWAAVVCFALLRAWRVFAAPGPTGALGVGVLGALVALLAFSVFNESFYLRHFWLLLLAAELLPRSVRSEAA